ncbi:MAG: alpha/beta hydrolase [Saprospiraceae bacterium]
MKQNLLLLHGALSSMAQMESLKIKLAEKFTVYSFNFPGHGGNKIQEEGITMDELADSIIAFLDENKILATNIFGYSMGGYAALKCALKHPTRIKQIICLGTKFDWSETALHVELNRLNEDFLVEKAASFIEEIKELHKPTDWRDMLKLTRDMMTNLSRVQALTDREFEQITTKVKLLLGDQDSMVSLAETNSTCSKFKNCSLEILEKTKHPLGKVDLELLAEKISQEIEGNTI